MQGAFEQEETRIVGKVVNEGYGDITDISLRILEGGENGTELYSLKEFSYAENGVRDTSDIKEKYSKGEFGAIPDPDLISALLEVDMNEDN